MIESKASLIKSNSVFDLYLKLVLVGNGIASTIISFIVVGIRFYAPCRTSIVIGLDDLCIVTALASLPLGYSISCVPGGIDIGLVHSCWTCTDL